MVAVFRERVRQFGTACPPGSLRCFAVQLAFAAGLALVWATLAFRQCNIEQQAIDFVNHALMVLWEAHPAPAETQDFYASYPRAAHFAAAQLMPLLDDDPIRAMRCLALFLVLALFTAQFTLLCRILPPAPALAALTAWQGICSVTRFADANHFSNNYFFSQAGGSAALWLVLVLLTTPTRTRWAHVACRSAALGAASLAYACHIAPGAVAFGTLVFWDFAALRRGTRRPALAGLAATLATAAIVVLPSRQLALIVQCRALEGDVPHSQLWLLLTWVPTLLVAATALLVRPGSDEARPTVARGLTCALLAAGMLQGYLAAEWYFLGTTGAYSAKKFFFYTFPLAAMLWVAWTVQACVNAPRWQWLVRGPQGRRVAIAVGVGAVLLLVGPLLRKDPFRPKLTPEDNPYVLAGQLAERRHDWPGNSYYHNPKRPMESLFVTAAGLQTNVTVACTCWCSLALKMAPFEKAARDAKVTHLLLPVGTDPRAALGLTFAAEPDGAFVRCDLGNAQPLPAAVHAATASVAPRR